MLHANSVQLFRHQLRLFVGHVRVLGAVDEKSGWIFRRYISHGTKPVEGSRLFIRINPGHFLRPESLLTAVKIKTMTVVLGGTFGNHLVADCAIGFRFGNGRLLGVERVGPAIPVAGTVAVAPE